MNSNASSYDAQLRMRRDAEERSIAHQDLGSFLDQIKSKSLKPKPKPKLTPAVEKSKDHQLASSQKSVLPHSSNARTETSTDDSSCDAERLRGNKLFAQGKYADAIQCYSRCLGKKDALTSPVVFSNRAMAHLKLKSWAQAEADATSALQIDSLHYKSYQRRCVARLSMGKVRAALLDICAAEDSCRLWMEHEKGSSSVASSAKSSLMEIQKLRLKVEKALMDAARRAPRRKIPVTVI